MSVPLKIERKVSEYVTRRKYRYRKVETRLPKGNYIEVYYPTKTSIITADKQFLTFAEKPYLVMQPPGTNYYLLIVPKWIPLRCGWLIPELSKGAYNVFRVDFMLIGQA